MAVDDRGSVLDERRVPTPRSDDDLVEVVGALVAALEGGPAAPGAGGGRATAGRTPVGVGAAGLVDRRGVLRFGPNLPGIVELALLDRLRSGPLRGRPVRVDNDATCAAFAETEIGAAAGCADVLMATIGTGIGGGLVTGGRLLRGHHGFAGEIGHHVVDPSGPPCVCGNRGCWERYASGSGLGWMAREEALAGRAARLVELAGGDPEAVRGEHVSQAAGEGDEPALGIFERVGWWLALGLANLATILDPELIVIGGGMVEAGPVLLEPARRAFATLFEGAAHRPAVPLVAARFGERAGAVGAALLARA